MVKEIITVIKIDKTSVSYEGSEYFSGCHISNFPDTPSVGKQYILESDFIHPSVIKSL